MPAKILLIIISLGGGLVVGGAIAAFITLIKLIPRLMQVTETTCFVRHYENAFALGAFIAIIIYFSDFHFNLTNLLAGIFASVMGMFIGLFSSALAEVLNVIPVLSKKFKFDKEKKYIIYALTLGKVCGSLYFWLLY